MTPKFFKKYIKFSLSVCCLFGVSMLEICVCFCFCCGLFNIFSSFSFLLSFRSLICCSSLEFVLVFDVVVARSIFDGIFRYVLSLFQEKARLDWAKTLFRLVFVAHLVVCCTSLKFAFVFENIVDRLLLFRLFVKFCHFCKRKTV
jgi:hypothetical protein